MKNKILSQEEFDKLNEDDKWKYIERKLREGSGYEIIVHDDHYDMIMHQSYPGHCSNIKLSYSTDR